MHLVEIFLPLNDNNGRPFGTERYAAVREHLTERFGGLTAFSRSPAQGATSDGGKTVHDEIIVFEVMARTLDVRGGSATGSILSGCFSRMRSWSVHQPSPFSDGEPQRRTSISFSRTSANRHIAGASGWAREN
jgi:hypothetical protein